MADDQVRRLLREVYGNPLIESPEFDPWRLPEPEVPPPLRPELRARRGPEAVTAPVSQTLAESAVGTARMPYDIPHDTAQAVADLLQRHYGEAATGAGAVLSQFIPIPGAPKGKPRAPRIPERRAEPGQTVTKPYRPPMYPVYDNPKEMVQVPIAPESGAMKEVFGGIKDPNSGERFSGTRDGLAEIGGHGTREGNMDLGYLKFGPKMRGAESASKVMNPRNEQRLHDILEEAGKIPGLRIGMDNWYVMDPAYWRLVEMYGPEEGLARYNHFNHMVGMGSPGTPVPDEIKRGLAAHFLESQGRFGDFQKHGGLAVVDPNNPKHFQADPKTKQLLLDQYGDPIPKPAMADIGMPEVPGHSYHKTSQSGPMADYLAAGRVLQMDSPKVPSYIWASGVPGTLLVPGKYQTKALVPDAHWSRGVGLADARHGPTDINASASMPEMFQLIPWWQRIAAEQGIEAVPAQARIWGALSGRTGVDTPVGAPKLELLAEHIKRRAAELGWPIDVTRDMILSGDMYAYGGGV